MTLKQTPLHAKSLECGCRMASFAGWEMPMQFSGLMNEHEAVRKKAGMFDISHMGVFLVQGKNAKDALQNLVPTDLYRIGVGEACYSVMLNESGGIIDDLIIYDLGSVDDIHESLLLVINAGCTDKDLAWLAKHIDQSNISITDYKKNGVLLALQGPDAEKILASFTSESLSSIPRFGHKNITLLKENLNSSIFLARTGYTGEEGFELLLTADAGEKFWDLLIQEGVTPCGLGARDTLRLEAAMHLYGNEMNDCTSPFEASLGWLVHLEMPTQFIGREVLEKQAKKGVSRKLVGLSMNNRSIARKGYQITYENKNIGEITSGTWSPTLGKAIALAYLPSECAKTGAQVNVSIRGKEQPATIVKRPFYKREK